MTFQRDKGGAEFYIAPNAMELVYDNVLHVNHLLAMLEGV